MGENAFIDLRKEKKFGMGLIRKSKNTLERYCLEWINSHEWG